MASHFFTSSKTLSNNDYNTPVNKSQHSQSQISKYEVASSGGIFIQKYSCENCCYNTNKKSNYDKHLSSEKHTRKVAVTNKNFECDICNYMTCIKSYYDKHLQSAKHKSNFLAIKIHKETKYHCDACSYYTNKKYNYDKHMSSKAHLNVFSMNMNAANDMSNVCDINLNSYNSDIENIYIDSVNGNDNDTVIIESDTISDFNHTIEKCEGVINENMPCKLSITEDTISSIMSEIKSIMIEQNKMNKIIQDIANKPIVNNNNSTNITNNNTNNHQFNMNMFLNETCKDAMNMSEFIENLTVTMEDMEMTGTLGFAKGMSRIIMNNLNALEVHKRPIHCSDAKRETLYVKNNGVWEKDTDDKKHTKELIYKVSSLNLKHLLKWRELPRNKGYDNPDHKKNDEFTILVMEINKVKIEEIEKVVTIISKNVTIDKNKVRMSGYLN